MKRFIEGENRYQSTLFPERLDDYIAEDNAVRVVDAFVEKLDLLGLGFEGVEPSATGRPAYHPAVLLKLYIYGYLNSIQSSRRLEREAQRNVELIWLTGRLMPVFKTIAGFRKDNRQAIRKVCLSFVELCRELELFSAKLVAIDGSKFKAVNSRDKNFTRKSVKRRIKKTQANIDRYLAKLDAVDEEEPEIREVTADELKQKIFESITTGLEQWEEGGCAPNIRHKRALLGAREAGQRVLGALQMRLTSDLIAVDLQECLDNLSDIVGETTTEDILDVIFAEFCLGK